MFQNCRHRPTKEIMIETKNKMGKKRSNLIKNIIDIKDTYWVERSGSKLAFWTLI